MRPAVVLFQLWLTLAAACLPGGATLAAPDAIPDIPIFINPQPPPETTPGADTTRLLARPGAATPPPAFTVKTAPPEGFEDLTSDETTLVDIYYGNHLVTTTMARFDEESIQLLNPAGVVSKLPHVTARPDIISAISGPLDPHSELICGEKNQTNCTTPQPPIAAVVFDQDNFRVDLHVNPRYLERISLASEQFLPDPERTLSSIHSIDALVSHDSDGRYHSFNSRSIIAYGKSRLIGQMRLEDNQTFSLDSLRFERDLKKWTWAFGTMDSIGQVSPLLSSRGFLGMRTARTLKMRNNLRLLRSSPMFVYLEERSRVDILRDGKLLSSRFYNPGNRQLDTTTLPDGTYKVTVRIKNNRGDREETHLFTRSVLIPPADHALHFLEAGSLLEITSSSAQSTVPVTTDDNIVHAGSRFRLRNNVGGELELLAVTQQKATLQGGLYYFLPRFSIHGGLLGGSQQSQGHYAAIDTRNTLFSVNLNHRSLSPANSAENTQPHPLFSIGHNTDLTLSANIGKDNLVMRAQQGRNSLGEKKTNYSLKYTRTLLHRGRSTWRLTANWNIDRSDQRWLLNLEYTSRQPQLEKAFSSSWIDTPEEQEHGLHVNARLSRALRHDNQLQGKDSVFIKSAATGDDLGLRLERNYRLGSGFIESRILYQNDDRTSFFTAGAHITATSSSTTLALSNKKTGLAGVVVEVEDSDEPFDIEIGSLTVKPDGSEKRKLILLEPYREYEVSLRPRGDRLVQFDSSVRKVTLYPGNISHLAWRVSPVVVVVGQAVSPDNTAIRNASFTDLAEFSTTDESGWFQVELASMQVLRLKTLDGKECGIDLQGKAPPPGEQVVVFDKLTCQPIAHDASE